MINDESIPAKERRELLLEFDNVLGLDISSADTLAKPKTQITKMAKDREELRINKQFAKADALRKKIERLGYTIEDTPYGPFLWPLKK